MRILFLSDIMGKGARKAVQQELAGLRRDLDLDFVVANAENASGGLGLSAKNARQLKEAGIDVMTGGNHIWRYKEIYPLLDQEPWLLRPANYPPGAPGKGVAEFSPREGLDLAVINLEGRIFMDKLDCPFRTCREILSNTRAGIVLVDFHAEATSEKKALLHFFRGSVSALIGTHTHVQTSDAQILDGYTGYITDAGMCGVQDSVIGMDPGSVMDAFLYGIPQKFEPATGQVELQGVLLDIDQGTGAVQGIQAWRHTCT